MSRSSPIDRAATDYDVVVIGGALSGASAALLIRRWVPDARVLVVERQETFSRKVGEATVELSGLFLTRILRLYEHLGREHLPKHGLRFWFGDHADRPLDELTEIGAYRVSGLPSFQLDRARLDEEVLRRGREAGAEVLRPAKVTSVDLSWPHNRVVIEAGGAEREVSARWILDASGRQTFLGRRLGLVERVDRHPTAAAWARWRGVADLDGEKVMGGDPASPRLPPLPASRRLATNHFFGYGFWCWVIPLSDGDTSVGLVWDKRHFQLPPGDRLADRYRAFVTREVPGLSRLLADAEPVEGDFLAYQSLPYRATKYADRGWALLGDAASFLDPYYSPGLDHAAISVYTAARTVQADLEGALGEEALDERLGILNERWLRSYDQWLDALYLDKYEIFGDAELTTAAFLFDTGMYYLGVVNPVWKDFESMEYPVLGLDHPMARLAYRTMHTFRRRLVRLARFRRRVGLYGKRNTGWRLYPKRFEIEPRRALGLVWRGTRLWLRAEAGYFVHRIRHGKPDLSDPVPRTTAEPAAGG